MQFLNDINTIKNDILIHPLNIQNAGVKYYIEYKGMRLRNGPGRSFFCSIPACMQTIYYSFAYIQIRYSFANIQIRAQDDYGGIYINDRLILSIEKKYQTLCISYITILKSIFLIKLDLVNIYKSSIRNSIETNTKLSINDIIEKCKKNLSDEVMSSLNSFIFDLEQLIETKPECLLTTQMNKITY